MRLKPDADHLTRDRWSRLAAETHQGMAHFARTGPRNKTCSDCQFRVEVRRGKLLRCDKFKALIGKTDGRELPDGHSSSQAL